MEKSNEKISETIKYNDENHELPFLNPKKITQGQTKILRLVDDLIRNKLFIRSLKRVIRVQNKWAKQFERGNYYAWTPEEKAEHDYFNDEAGKIIDEYEKLKKRANKLIHSKDYKNKEKIASRYGLDSYLINLAIARYKKDNHSVSRYLMEGGDMCRIHADFDEQMSVFNKGDDWIRMKPINQLEIIVYPLSIAIHRNASKRDVLDFIEKNWWFINKSSVESDEKTYRARKRKHSPEVLDFIWQNHSLPAIKIKQKLDEKFPKNGFVYYEISKIIQLEKTKRLGNFEL